MLRCPRCYQHDDIHKSHARSMGERLGWWLVLRRPVRCYSCGYRFTSWIFRHAKPRVKIQPQQQQKQQQQQHQTARRIAV